MLRREISCNSWIVSLGFAAIRSTKSHQADCWERKRPVRSTCFNLSQEIDFQPGSRFALIADEDVARSQHQSPRFSGIDFLENPRVYCAIHTHPAGQGTPTCVVPVHCD